MESVLYWIQAETGTQWRWWQSGVMWSVFFFLNVLVGLYCSGFVRVWLCWGKTREYKLLRELPWSSCKAIEGLISVLDDNMLYTHLIHFMAIFQRCILGQSLLDLPLKVNRSSRIKVVARTDNWIRHSCHFFPSSCHKHAAYFAKWWALTVNSSLVFSVNKRGWNSTHLV